MKIKLLHITAALLAFSSFLVLAATISNPYAWPNIYADLFYNPLLGWTELFAVVVAPIIAIIIAVITWFTLPRNLGKHKALATVSASGFAVVMWLASDIAFSSYAFVSPLEVIFQSMNGASQLGFARLLLLLALGLSIFVVVRGDRTFVTKWTSNSSTSRSKARDFLKTLFDSSLENFISRRVSGVLYIITAWLIVIGSVLLEFALLSQMLMGSSVALLTMLLVPVITLLTLIIVRMAFEAGIALIVIAENTKK
jgi:hypothetical protein